MSRARKPEARTRSMEAELRKECYELRLFVTGSTSRSLEAVTQVKLACEENLKGRYQLEVFDVYQDPDRAEDDQIIALPTLVKRLPLPVRRIIGDFADRKRLLSALGIVPVP